MIGRGIFQYAITLAAACILSACSQGNGNGSLGFTQHTDMQSALPQLPVPAYAPRSVAAVQTKTGEMTFLKSDGSVLNGNKAELDTAAGESQWVMYQFDTTVEPRLQTLEAEVEFVTGYYIAISNYSTGRWDFSGPYESSHIMDLGSISDDLSNGTHTYVAILCHGGKEAVVNSVTLSSPSPVTPDWVHSYGEQTDEFGNDYFEVLQGVTADADGNVYTASTRVRGDNSSDDFALVLRYDKDGMRTMAKTIRWTDSIYVDDIVVDSSGNIYVVVVDGDLEMFKLDSDGALIWAKTYELVGRGDQWRMRMDSDGNLLLSGTHDVWSEDDRGCVLKFDQDGNQLWGKQWPHAFFTPDVEMAVLGTDVFVLDDNETASGFEAKYPMLIAFDKDANLIGSKLYIDTGDEPVFAAFGSETITAGNGRVYLSGLSQDHIDGQFVTLHKQLSFKADLSDPVWHSGVGSLPAIQGTIALGSAIASDGSLFILGRKINESFNLGRFAPDGSFTGAWDITGTNPLDVLVQSDYNHDRHRALLMMGPAGSIYAAGSTRDITGLTLVPASVSSHDIGGDITDVVLEITDVTAIPSDVEGVTVLEGSGLEDVPGQYDDTLVMRLSL